MNYKCVTLWLYNVI